MSEQTANLCTTDACESLRQRLAKYEDAEGRPLRSDLRYTSDGELAECPCCGSLDVGGANGTVSCYGCDLQITKPRPLQNAADAWNKRAALKAQPSGVVPELPGEYSAACAAARLNSSPVSDGDERVGWTEKKPTEEGAYWIRGNGLEADALVQVKQEEGELWCNLHMRNSEPDFEYGYTIEQLSSEFEWLGPLQARATLSPAREDVRGADPVKAQLLENALRLSANRMDRLAIEFAHGSEMRWTVSEWAEESRAALSAPSHGGGVAHTDCRSEDGITVGLIDSIITSCRVLSSRDLTCEAAVEALRDLRSDSDVSLIKPNHSEQVREGWQLVPVEPTDAMLEAGDKYIGTPATYKSMLSACPSPAITKDFSQFLSAVMDAAGLIRHGRQSKELSEYLGMKCMEYRGAAPSAGSQGGDV